MAMETSRQVETWRKEDLIVYILNDLNKRIRHDNSTKQSVLFTAISAYLKEPVNLFLKGESGIGKTYNVVQTLRYFPPEDVWLLGGLSPKALIHGYGELTDQHGEKFDCERPLKPLKKEFKDREPEYRTALENYKERLNEWKDEVRQSYTLVDLSHKILVFLELPDFNTYKMLYPILSHDAERIEHRFTDKTPRGQFKQSRVIIQGWPATVFLSTDKRYMEELSTRSFTATPDSSKDKIRDANELTNLRASKPWEYNHETPEQNCINNLIQSIKRQFTQGNLDVVIPFTNLHELFPTEIPRDMRDFAHFTQFLKSITALNIYQRSFVKINDKIFLISTAADVKKALNVYNEIFETTRTGTEQRILDFYYDVIVKGDLWYLGMLTQEYNKRNEKKLSSFTIRKWLDRLNEIGYVEKAEDKADRRLNVYMPIKKEKEEIVAIDSKTETPTILDAKLREGFESWRKNIGIGLQYFSYKDLAENKWGEVEIKAQDLEQAIIPSKDFSNEYSRSQIPTSDKEDKGFMLENSPENACVSVLQTKPTISKNEPKIIEKEDSRIEWQIGDHVEKAHQCLLCKSNGKPVLFSSRHDLSLHIQRLHGGFPDSKSDYVS